jgi:hypothetical protein
MPIKFACSCGTQLRVADKDAGRRIKCPKCGDTLTTPDAPTRTFEPDEEEDRRTRRRHDPDDDGIQESPRRRTAAAADDEDEDRPARRRRGRDDDDDRDDDRERDDRDDDEDRKSRRKKRPRKEKKAWPMVLAIVLGALLLLGGGGFGVAWFFFMRTPNVSDFAFVPPDAGGFVTIRVADMWKLDSTQKMLTAMRMRLPGTDPFLDIQHASGLAANDVERLTIVFQDIDQPTPTTWYVVQTLKPYDMKTIRDTLNNPKEVKHEGRTYFLGPSRSSSSRVPPAPPGRGPGRGPGGGGPPMPPGGVPGMPGESSSESAICFAGQRVLIYSNDAGMRRCLTAAARKKPTGPLAGAILQAGGAHQVVASFTLTQGAQQKLKGLTAMIPAGKLPSSFQAMLDLTGCTIVSDTATDGSNQTDFTLAYPDADKAAKAKKGFDGLRALAELGLPSAEEQIKQFMPPDDAARVIGFLKGILDNLGADVNGSDLKIRLKFDSKAIEALIPKGPQ